MKMKKLQFRIELFQGANPIAESIVLAAARSNSGFAPLSIEQLYSLGEGLIQQFPDIYKNTTFSLVDNDNSLHIDARPVGEDKYQLVGRISLVEIHELYEDEEKVTILSGTEN